MKRRIVLDTNVIYAGLRSRRGASFRLMEAVGTGLFDIVVSVPLVLEYEEVLRRKARSLGLTFADVADVIDYLCDVAEKRQIFFLWRPFLKDPNDDMILELAVEASCNRIVTFNRKDFIGIEQFEIQVVTPAEMLHELEEIE